MCATFLDGPVTLELDLVIQSWGVPPLYEQSLVGIGTIVTPIIIPVKECQKHNGEHPRFSPAS